MKKQSVIVTGGVVGIGRAICNGFPLDQYDVYGIGRGIVDVRDPDSIATFMKGKCPDILVNNAGVITTGNIDGINLTDTKTMIDTNLYGTLHYTRAVLPGMRRRGSGYIINIASLRAKHPAAGKSVYSMTKAAIRSLTESLNLENAKYGIRSTAICPDTVDTAMGRSLEPDAGRMSLIDPHAISDTVQWLIRLPENVIINEVVMERRMRYA